MAGGLFGPGRFLGFGSEKDAYDTGCVSGSIRQQPQL